MSEETAKLQETNEKLKKDVVRLEDVVKSVKMCLDDSETTLGRLKDYEAKFSTQGEAIGKLKEDIQKKETDHSERIKEIDTEMKTKDAKLEKMLKVVENLVAETKKKVVEMNERDEKIKALSAQLEELKKVSSAGASGSEDLKKTLVAKQEEMEKMRVELQKHVTDKEAQIEELKKKLEEASKSGGAPAADGEALKKVQAQLKASEGKVAALEKSGGGGGKSPSPTEALLKKKLQQYVAVIQQLKNQLVHTQKTVKQLQAGGKGGSASPSGPDVQKYVAVIQQLKKQLIATQNQLKAFKAKGGASSPAGGAETQQLMKMVQEKDKALAQYKSALLQAQGKVQTLQKLQSSPTQAAAMVMEKEKEIAELKKKLEAKGPGTGGEGGGDQKGLSDLMAQLNAEKKKSAGFTKVFHDKEQEIQKFRKQLSDLVKVYNIEKKKAGDFEKKLRGANDALFKVKADLQEFQSVDVKEKMEKLEVELKQTKENYTVLKKKYAEVTKVTNLKEITYGSLKNLYEEKNARIERLRKIVDAFEFVTAHVHEKLGKDVPADIGKDKKKIQVFPKMMQTLKQKVKNSQNTMKEKQKEYTEMLKAKKMGEIESIKKIKTLKLAVEQRKDQSVEVEKLRTENGLLSKKVSDHEKKIGNLGQKLIEKDSALVNALRVADELKGGGTGSIAAAKQKNDVYAANMKKMAKVQKKLDQKTRVVDAFQLKNRELFDQSKRFQNDIKELKKEIEILEKKLLSGVKKGASAVGGDKMKAMKKQVEKLKHLETLINQVTGAIQASYKDKKFKNLKDALKAIKMLKKDLEKGKRKIDMMEKFKRKESDILKKRLETTKKRMQDAEKSNMHEGEGWIQFKEAKKKKVTKGKWTWHWVKIAKVAKRVDIFKKDGEKKPVKSFVCEKLKTEKDPAIDAPFGFAIDVDDNLRLAFAAPSAGEKERWVNFCK